MSDLAWKGNELIGWVNTWLRMNWWNFAVLGRSGNVQELTLMAFSPFLNFLHARHIIHCVLLCPYCSWTVEDWDMINIFCYDVSRWCHSNAKCSEWLLVLYLFEIFMWYCNCCKTESMCCEWIVSQCLNGVIWLNVLCLYVYIYVIWCKCPWMINVSRQWTSSDTCV